MKYKVCEGNYAKLGIMKIGKQVIFTFEGEKEANCRIAIVNKNDLTIEKIDVPDEFCLGSLRSVSITGIDTDNSWYLLEINGKMLVDPYAAAVAGREKWNDLSRKDNNYQTYGSFFVPKEDERDCVAPEIDKSEMVMYKLHVRGFTMGNHSKDKSAGTFRSFERKIPYLKQLGVTTLEFMPVYEFEELVFPEEKEIPEYMKRQMEKGLLEEPFIQKKCENKVNYWGYEKGNYFAVKASYASDCNHSSKEFQSVIKKLHNNQMECIMEMYFPEETNESFILDVLRFWVEKYHIDGFHLIGNRIPISMIVQDPRLRRTKIFYGKFSSELLSQEMQYKRLFVYNDEYLYPARRILNHINGDMQEFINQQKKQDENTGFVNYMANNNGFTLADLFMYNDKHNELNGENNEDGSPWNFSSNYGIEGPSRRKYVLELRKRQWRNAMMMTILAQGVPLIWEGDEMRKTQNGNNNAYCQDNEISWIKWSDAHTNKDDLLFVRKLIEFRKSHLLLAQNMPFQFMDYQSTGIPDVSLHGENAWISGIFPGRMNIGVLYNGDYSTKDEKKEYIYIGYNFYSRETELALPKPGKHKKWHLVASSALKEDGFYEEPLLLENQKILTMEPQSICIVIGK